MPDEPQRGGRETALREPAVSDDRWVGEDEAWLSDRLVDPDPSHPVGLFRALIVVAALGALVWAFAVVGLTRIF
jgi:hypothetical protein